MLTCFSHQLRCVRRVVVLLLLLLLRQVLGLGWLTAGAVPVQIINIGIELGSSLRVRVISTCLLPFVARRLNACRSSVVRVALAAPRSPRLPFSARSVARGRGARRFSPPPVVARTLDLMRHWPFGRRT